MGLCPGAAVLLPETVCANAEASAGEQVVSVPLGRKQPSAQRSSVTFPDFNIQLGSAWVWALHRGLLREPLTFTGTCLGMVGRGYRSAQ